MGTKRRNSKLISYLAQGNPLVITIEAELKEQQNLRELNDLNSIFNTLAEYVIAMDIKSVSNSHQAIIRFHNDYGVSILPLLTRNGRKLYEILVLKFHGPGFNDYKIAQYATVPEINWVYDDDVLGVCRQVYLLQKKGEGLLSPRIAV